MTMHKPPTIWSQVDRESEVQKARRDLLTALAQVRAMESLYEDTLERLQ